MKKPLVSKEKKCPNPKCGSEKIIITGGSNIVTGRKKHIGFECLECKTKFWISEVDYKP